MSTLNVKLTHNHSPIPYGIDQPRIRVSFNSQPVEEAVFEHYCDSMGTVSIELMPSGTFTIYPLAEGYEGGSFQVVMPHDDQILIEMSKVTAQLSSLGLDGFYFKNAGGRLRLTGATSFLAYKKFLDGEDLSGHFGELQEIGFNLIRVFGMVDSFSHWYPQNYGDRYYDEIPNFLDLAASYGLYVYFTVFADTRIVMPDPIYQRGHWARVCEQLKSQSNALVEKGNELDQHSNAVDGILDKPDGLLSCSGSNGSNPDPSKPFPTPYWDFCDLHVRRDYPKSVSDACVVEVRLGYSGYPGAQRPVAHGEPPGFDEQAGPHGRWTDPERAREFSSSAGTAAFTVFHSDAGILSQQFGPVVRACAEAWVGR